jgi:hypothetical protein
VGATIADPRFVGAIPVAGFEIESSWRTRKHVKGDLLNLQDAGVALGVFAGADTRDDSLRRFAETLVDRPGPTMLVWKRVRALGTGQVTVAEVETGSASRISSARPESPFTSRRGARWALAQLPGQRVARAIIDTGWHVARPISTEACRRSCLVRGLAVADLEASGRRALSPLTYCVTRALTARATSSVTTSRV